MLLRETLNLHGNIRALLQQGYYQTFVFDFLPEKNLSLLTITDEEQKEQ